MSVRYDASGGAHPALPIPVDQIAPNRQMYLMPSRDALQSMKQSFGKYGQAMQLYVLAETVLVETLGLKWWRTHYDKIALKTDAVFESKEKYESEKLDRLNRSVRLADRLYGLRHCEGYEGFVSALKTYDLEATFFELEVAHMFYQSGHVVRFLRETAVKQDDYDLSVEIGGIRVAIEAKSRRFGAIADENALRNALENAGQQLPEHGPGVIFIAIPPLWTQVSDAEPKIGETISAFFKLTERVNHVVLFWNTWEWIQGKVAATLCFRQFDNNQRRHPFFHRQIVTLLQEPIPFPSFW